MNDLTLQLIAAAGRAKQTRQFWEVAATLLRGWAGDAGVVLRYAGTKESGVVTAGPPGAGSPQKAEWHDAEGRRVELEVTGARPDLTAADLRAGVELVASLAVMAGRRANLERERRLGTFLVELSRWLLAAPEKDLLLRYTLQSVMRLVDAQGAFVALREGGASASDSLRVAMAVGETAPLQGKELSVTTSVAGRVIRTGEALMSADLRAERDTSPIARYLQDTMRGGMIAPLHTSAGVVGAVGVARHHLPGAPAPEPFTLHELHYFTAVAAHIAGGLELSQAVAATRAAADRARAMVNASPLPMALVDTEGVVLQINLAGAQVFGLETEQTVLGRHLDGLGLSPSGIPLRLVLAGRQDGEPWHGRVLVTQPSGDRRICDCTVTGLTGLGSRDLLVALYDRTDELRAQRELIAREKLATVGEIASGVAHEVNNPLAAIRMEAELLARSTRDPETTAATSTIVREVDRAARIVRSLLRLARRADTAPTRIQVNELVRDVAEIRQRVLRADNVEFRTRMDQAAPAVLGLGQELQQVVINLVTNAEHAVRKTGSGERPAVIQLTTQARNGWVRLTVEDSGTGIPQDIRARIFDPFFTTKGPDEGSGLGLAICQRVVAEVGGKLWLEDSEELGGAKFVVELPTAPDRLDVIG
ncbi:MAG: two-component system sensor histidine kinase NtrB [Gemmatimonadales bacterium]